MAILRNRDRENRPWGSFERFTLNEPSTVKILRLAPGQSVSLQRHSNRAEFWHVITGEGTVTIGEEKRPATAGSEFEIPTNTLHRISAGESELIWLEIAIGTFDESDEERIEDDYGRTAGSG
jgi:mannose-1-phosphate guanylyltransferase/mannose-1-phosphate guanylyltransferase/mannose-6-phosphate isomerase